MMNDELRKMGMRGKIRMLWYGCCLLVLAGCGLEQQAPSGPWHQRYEPVDDPEVLAYVDKCFVEAKRLFGPPIVRVREVHVRWSEARRNVYRLCRADIADWPALVRVLASPSTAGERYVAGMLSPGARKALLLAGQGMNWRAQLMVVADMNRIMQDMRFLAHPGLHSLELPEDLRRGLRGGELRDSRNRLRVGRRMLSVILPGLILPAPKRVGMGTGFSLCECTDSRRGIFVIYIDARPRTADFYLKLGHEAAHLLNANLYDWYVEGLNTAFSRHMARMTGKTWQPFADLFSRGSKRDPYAISFFMMERVWGIAGRDMRNFFRFAVPSGHHGRMEIDIDGWLRSLPVGKRGRVIRCIGRYAPGLYRHRGKLNRFNWPKELAARR